MPSGIYKIQGSTERFYVGSSKDLEYRRRSHWDDLGEGRHVNLLLQRTYNRGDDLTFSILEFCEEEDLLIREQWWLDYFWPTGLLYNINPKAICPHN